MSSVNKRKEAVTSEEVLPGKKKLSRQARYNKKRKLEKEQILLFPVEPNIPIPTSINDIVFDPNRVYITSSYFMTILFTYYVRYVAFVWQIGRVRVYYATIGTWFIQYAKNSFIHEKNINLYISCAMWSWRLAF